MNDPKELKEYEVPTLELADLTVPNVLFVSGDAENGSDDIGTWIP